MLLTADHLAALDELEGDTAVPPPPFAPTERAGALYRVLARDGLARRMQGRGYSLTTEGRDAQRLVAGMLAGGYLPPREVMAPEWHFIDDDVLSAMEAAAGDAGRVASSDAPLLLTRGLATLREEPDELCLSVSLTGYGRAWLELASRLRQHADNVDGTDAAMHIVPGSVGTASHTDAATLV